MSGLKYLRLVSMWRCYRIGQSLSEEINQAKNLFFRSDQISVQIIIPSPVLLIIFVGERGMKRAIID